MNLKGLRLPWGRRIPFARTADKAKNDGDLRPGATAEIASHHRRTFRLSSANSTNMSGASLCISRWVIQAERMQRIVKQLDDRTSAISAPVWSRISAATISTSQAFGGDPHSDDDLTTSLSDQA